MSARARDSFIRRYDMRRNAETILRVFENPQDPANAHAAVREAR
jgi:hypothetical protein